MNSSICVSESRYTPIPKRSGRGHKPKVRAIYQSRRFGKALKDPQTQSRRCGAGQYQIAPRWRRLTPDGGGLPQMEAAHNHPRPSSISGQQSGGSAQLQRREAPKAGSSKGGKLQRREAGLFNACERVRAAVGCAALERPNGTGLRHSP